jgi:hypothetical protein
MSTVRTEMKGRGAAKFEEVLRRLFDSPNEFIKRQMKSVPLALHHYFYEVSTAYTTEPINYSHMLNRTIGQGIHTALVTLNYDTLLESSISKVTGVRFSRPSDYIAMPDVWLLAKVHGSADWGYRWTDAETRMVSGPEVAAELLEPPVAHTDNIETGIPLGLRKAQYWYYPALALPVAGKFGFVCPSSHVGALEDFVASCENFLFIGFSANDDDLLEFLNKNVREVRRVRIVAGSASDLRDVGDRLFRSVPKFFRAQYIPEVHGFATGFTAYLAGPFDDLLQSVLTGG